MKNNTCCFFGHRKIKETNELRERLKEIIEDMIINKNVREFLFGSKSEFDSLCHQEVSELKVKYKNSATSMDLEDFPNITDEKLEKTTVDHVFCTKFNHVTHSAYDDEWNIEEINKMSTRDLITAVYQSISVKLKK